MSARILVVDDIEANRRLLQAKLEARYFDVLLAANGDEALEIVSAQDPDIILLDVMMPGLDGYEVCRRLKANPATMLIPVVMVTALSEPEHRIRGLEAGAEDFVTKPFNDFELMTRIEALMRYNAVAEELREREARGLTAGVFDDVDLGTLNRRVNIIVVDENPRAANRLCETLRQAGHAAASFHEVGLADQGESGDVVIISLDAESFDPLRLCARFRIDERTRALSIIVAADPADRDRASRALKIGASDVIFTPVDTQELLARVKTQARRKRYVDILRRRVDLGLELSVIDPLTGLHNRRYMAASIDKWLHRAAIGGAPFSLAVLDIDHFKRVNDVYGHVAGDVVLKEFAQRLTANVRPSDVVCRQGGEEFIIVMPDTPGDVATIVAERVRDAVASETFDIGCGGDGLRVTVSAGVATFQGAGETGRTLLERADDALYRAKSQGRNRVEGRAA